MNPSYRASGIRNDAVYRGIDAVFLGGMHKAEDIFDQIQQLDPAERR